MLDTLSFEGNLCVSVFHAVSWKFGQQGIFLHTTSRKFGQPGFVYTLHRGNLVSRDLFTRYIVEIWSAWICLHATSWKFGQPGFVHTLHRGNLVSWDFFTRYIVEIWCSILRHRSKAAVLGDEIILASTSLLVSYVSTSSKVKQTTYFIHVLREKKKEVKSTIVLNLFNSSYHPHAHTFSFPVYFPELWLYNSEERNKILKYNIFYLENNCDLSFGLCNR